jgi:MbtH protein
MERTMQDRNSDDTRQYTVVVNHEEQFSIWFADRDIPPGWRSAGKTGLKQECLDHIALVWTDMRPLSLRKALESGGH